MSPKQNFLLRGQLVPKDETLASQLLKVNPDYDGRGVVVGILDTGVDPGAIGLQTTPQGEPKIVDIIDATGSGDVDMTKTIKVENIDEPIEGLTGRKLKLSAEWTNPSGEFHLGIKSAYELFPGPLVSRIKKERREKWDIEQRQGRKKVQEKLKDWNEKHKNKSNVTSSEIDLLEDLKAQDKYLQDFASNYEDVGPIYDCVSFFDGKTWRGAIDTEETGDFTAVSTLADYSLEHEYGTLSNRSQMNYVLKFYDDGKVMCIVCDAGAHGSHVAGIVAAYHPDEPDNNGIAPGAQIVSIKIGDSRLASMETGVGLTRALISVLLNKCDVINMSYGEFAGLHDVGRFIELSKELVDEHGVVFVSSAGNEGPALTTVGAAGGTTSCILGVGAYVSPSMQDTEYTMGRKTQPIAYTWSSRGPTFDGDFGVNICAPGGAITAVPNWTLQRCRLMNGTSMSSPNCAGNIALLISAMKQNNVAYTPYSIRRALENTAAIVDGVEPFAQGRGLIQVTDALDYLLKYQTMDGNLSNPLRYDVSIPARKARGIYLRQESETAKDIDVTVQVNPVFHKEAPQEAKVEYQCRIKLKATVPWITVGENLALMHGGRTFSVSVHNTQLSPGKHYFGEIIGYDSDYMDRKAIFRIPVTVIKPKQFIQGSLTYSLDMVAGKIDRRFYTVPHHATWLNVKVSRKDDFDSSRLLALHLLQMVPQERQSKTSLDKVFRLECDKDVTYSMSVVAGTTIELCLAQYWSSIGSTELDLSFEFRGVVPDKSEISFGGDGYTRVMLNSQLHTEKIMPVAKLNNWLERIRPGEYLLEPLSSRDVLPNGRQIYQLVLTYNVTKIEEGDVVPRFPILNGLLYESPYESQLCMVFDSNKRFVGASDAFTEKIKLKKGEYVFRMQVRHDEVEKLEKLKNMILMLEHSIKEVPLSVYSDNNAAVVNGDKSRLSVLTKGTNKAYFITEPEFDKLPKGTKSGDVLQGSITYRQNDSTENGSSTKPKGFAIKYNCPPEPKKEKQPEVADAVDKRPEEEKTNDAVRDLLIGRLKKIEKKEEFNVTYNDLAEKYPNHVPLLEAKLDFVVKVEDDDDDDDDDTADEIITTAQSIIDAIDQEKLIIHFGLKVDKDDPDAQKDNKEKIKLKESLINAYSEQLSALGKDKSRKEDFLKLYKDFQKWVDDVQNYKYIYVALYYHEFSEQHGTALARLTKFYETDKKDRIKIMSDEVYHEKVQDILKKLEWNHILTSYKQEKILSYPSSYAPF